MKSSTDKNQGIAQKEKKNTLLPFGAFRTIIKTTSKDNLAKPTSRSAISYDHDGPQISSRPNGSPRKGEKSPDDSTVVSQKLDKKRELQKNLQEHYVSSNATHKSFTNALSQRIAEKKRPNLKVEDILLGKGRESKQKIRKLEQDLYGKVKSPTNTQKTQPIKKDDSIYQRLYELEKERNNSSSRRETMDAKIPKSDSTSRLVLNHNASQRSLSGESRLKSSNSPLKASLTEILSKAAQNKSMLSPNKFDVSTISSPMSQKNGLSSPNSSSARFLKPKAHNEEKADTARDFSYIPLKKGKEIEHKIEEKLNESMNNQSFSQDIKKTTSQRGSSATGYKTLSGFIQSDPNKSVLPNMLYFKNHDNRNKIIRADQNFAEKALESRDKSGISDNNTRKNTQEKKNKNEIQKFYTKIAQLDFKHDNPFESPRDKRYDDYGHRTQTFLSKKNEKLQNQKATINSKEHSEYLSQPQFTTLRTVKSASKEPNIFEKARRVSGDMVSPSRNYIKEKPRTVENSASKDKNPPSRLVPNREPDNIQKKLYDYILNK